MKNFAIKDTKTMDGALLSSKERKSSLWKNAWIEASWVFLISRLILIACTFLGPGVFAYWSSDDKRWENPFICISQARQCIKLWDHWDVGVFVDVARAGYWKSDNSLTPFFPGFPLLVHIFGGSFPHPYTALFYTGLIVANVCFILGLVFLYHNVSRYFTSAIARDTLLLLAINPYGLFFFVGYSESLFFLLCMMMFFFLERQKPLDWWLAGACGLCASLTRALGIVFVIPFLVILLQYLWPYRRTLLAHWRLFFNATLPLCLVPLGLLIYMVYLAIITGNPFEFSVTEAHQWGRMLDFPWKGIINDIMSFIKPDKHFESNLLDLFFTILSIFTLCVGWKTLPWHYRFFALILLMCSLSTPIQGIGYPLSSMPRFMMIIFPLFIIAAIWSQKNPRLRSIIIGASLVLFTFHALLFLANGWVA
ncbi:hypothetical protein [Tengunoibacter tsumagoiensis]|uniref:hypothetical protein n=1 Tax=Tengunoibacter tsumagoiensis TaxID=2014871 RepID=UPI000F8464A4|nr:hypothetical protein [Tengunoibacter tsumagoiensis]